MACRAGTPSKLVCVPDIMCELTRSSHVASSLSIPPSLTCNFASLDVDQGVLRRAEGLNGAQRADVHTGRCAELNRSGICQVRLLHV